MKRKPRRGGGMIVLPTNIDFEAAALGDARDDYLANRIDLAEFEERVEAALRDPVMACMPAGLPWSPELAGVAL